MKKVIKKIRIIVFVLIISLMMFASNVYADPIIDAEYYKPPEIGNAGKVATIGNTIIGGIQFVGSIVSVIVLIIIGIRFMVGSAEQRAEYKEAMRPYIIGAIMLFSISNLLGIISDLFS